MIKRKNVSNYEVYDKDGKRVKACLRLIKDEYQFYINEQKISMIDWKLTIFSSGKLLARRKSPLVIADVSYYVYEFVLNDEYILILSQKRKIRRFLQMISTNYSDADVQGNKHIVKSSSGHMLKKCQEDFVAPCEFNCFDIHVRGGKDDKDTGYIFEQTEISWYQKSNFLYPSNIKFVWNQDFVAIDCQIELWPHIASYKRLYRMNLILTSFLVTSICAPFFFIMLSFFWKPMRAELLGDKVISGDFIIALLLLVTPILFDSIIIYVLWRFYKFYIRQYIAKIQRRK